MSFEIVIYNCIKSIPQRREDFYAGIHFPQDKLAYGCNATVNDKPHFIDTTSAKYSR